MGSPQLLDRVIRPEPAMTSLFCVALYDYQPQDHNELAIQQGELIYIVEKSTEDGWWRAKKKASSGKEKEPVGRYPNTMYKRYDIRSATHAMQHPSSMLYTSYSFSLTCRDSRLVSEVWVNHDIPIGTPNAPCQSTLRLFKTNG